MRVAVVTPTYPRRLDWLAQCHASVRAQTHPCTHILVADGGEPHGLADFDGQFIALHRKHNDYGNTPRTVGALSAAAQGFDAICYLDDDNWYSPKHVETMVALHRQTGAPVCSTPRLLYDPQDVLFGKDPQSDGVHHVDTNCYFVAKPAFDMLSVWALVPPDFCYVTDFYFLDQVKRRGHRHAHYDMKEPTVHYRTHWKSVYKLFGRVAPADARVDARKDVQLAKLFSLPR